MENNINFKRLLKRKQLTQQRFTELAQDAWADITGRSLSRQSVSAWANDREIPTFTPAEMLAIIDLLECTFTEFVLAFGTRKKKSFKKGLTNVKCVLYSEDTQNSAPPKAPTN